MVRTETYRDLCHGTYEEAAEKIIVEGFKPSKEKNSWCGSGIYFYDVRAKAWWSANRTCETKKAETGIRHKPAVVFADIVDIPKADILDLRSPADMGDFQTVVSELFDRKTQLTVDEIEPEERIIALRSMLISFYAKKKDKKLIIGTFQQREQPLHQGVIEFASGLNLILGVETIYCVRDGSILQNMRQGGNAK